MTLFHPGTNIEFNVTPAYLLGGFNVYDREDDLELELNRLDPNKEDELDKLLIDYFLNSDKSRTLTVDHKKRILKVIDASLKNPLHDFQQYFVDDDDSCFYLPSEWNVKNPRFFFMRAYELLSRKWRE